MVNKWLNQNNKHWLRYFSGWALKLNSLFKITKILMSMSPLDKRRRRVHKTSVHTVKAVPKKTVPKGVCVQKLFQKRLRAKVVSRALARKSCSKSSWWLLAYAQEQTPTGLFAALAFKWVTGGSNSPGRSDWLTALTAKCYVSVGNMIAS